MELLCAIQASEWERTAAKTYLMPAIWIPADGVFITHRRWKLGKRFARRCDTIPTQNLSFGSLLRKEFFRAETRLAEGSIIFRARVGCDTDEEGLNDPYRDADIGAPRSYLTDSCDFLI